jgi:hypothetical protein
MSETIHDVRMDQGAACDRGDRLDGRHALSAEAVRYLRIVLAFSTPFSSANETSSPQNGLTTTKTTVAIIKTVGTSLIIR